MHFLDGRLKQKQKQKETCQGFFPKYPCAAVCTESTLFFISPVKFYKVDHIRYVLKKTFDMSRNYCRQKKKTVVGEDVEKLESLLLVSEYRADAMENSMAVTQNIKHRITL